MSILRVASRLNNPDMDALVRPYLETTVSKRRIGLLLALIAYVYFIASVSKSPVLLKESGAVLPVLAGLLVLSIGWAVLIRKSRLGEYEYTNAIGTLMDFIGIWSLMHFAWNIMLIMVPVLIGVVITTGARYSPKYFYSAMLMSIIVVLSGAPSGYWMSRPVFAVLAVALLVALPLTVYKLLKTLKIISEIAVEASETQTRFMSTVSHELRTPLNSVIAGTGILYDAPLDEKQREVLGLVEKNGRHLLGMVNDLLDHAAHGNTESPLRMQAFSMSELLAECENIVQMKAMEKQIRLVFDCQLDNDVVISDRGLVSQVVVNLAGNAVKYSANKTAVSVVVERNEEGLVKVTVKDQGIGIPDNKKSAIFDLFVRVGDNRQQEGSGFGLNLVKMNSMRLGGTVSVRDNEGSGSVFEWVVPMEEGIDAGSISRSISMQELIERHKKRMAPISCLVVDDNLSNCLIMTELLKKAGHWVSYVTSGEECLESIKTATVDLIILDINLGSMSGWDVMREMQVLGLAKEPKVIISSAAVDKVSQDMALESGAVEFLAKPVDIWRLVGMLEQLFLGKNVGAQASLDLHQSPLAMIKASGDEKLLLDYLAALESDLKSERDYFKKADLRDIKEIGSRVHYLKNVMNNLDRFDEALACQHFRDRVMSGEIISKSDLDDILKMINEGLKFIHTETSKGVYLYPALD